jgi:hypothetical protein
VPPVPNQQAADKPAANDSKDILDKPSQRPIVENEIEAEPSVITPIEPD